MKKVLFVLMFAVIAFAGCAQQQEATTATPENAPAAATAPATTDNAQAPAGENAQAPAAPQAPATK